MKAKKGGFMLLQFVKKLISGNTLPQKILLGSVLSKEQETQYQQYMAIHSKMWHLGMLGFILIFQVFNISFVLFYTQGCLHTTPSRIYMALYLFLMASAILSLCLYILFSRQLPEKSKCLLRSEQIFQMTFLLWAVLITAYDQRVNENINVYLIAALTTSFLGILQPPQALVTYGTAQVLLMVLMPVFQPAGTDNYGSWLNLLVVNAASIMLVFFRAYFDRLAFRDRERILHQNELLYQLAHYDTLTGAWSRRFLTSRLPQIFHHAVQTHSWLSLFMLDVDDFKRYNDQFGHQKGDVCLKQVAEALQKCLQEDQYLIRYGGEEFLCVIEGLDQAAAMELGEKFCRHIRDLQLPGPMPQHSSYLSISVGICCQVPVDGQEWEQLLHHADRALYLAKNRGKNQVVCAWLEPEEADEM